MSKTESLTIEPKKLYSARQAGAVLGFHKESIRRLIRQQKLPAVYVGRFPRVQGEIILKVMTEGL
jgi:excisionase family DNA binding protein